MLGEEEVGGCSAPGMEVRALRSAPGGPGVEGGDGPRIEGDVPLGAELAERHPQPRPGRPVVDDAAELEPRSGAGKLWEHDPAAGRRRDLLREEDHALWSWAIIEARFAAIFTPRRSASPEGRREGAAAPPIP